jgi:nitroreductase
MSVVLKKNYQAWNISEAEFEKLPTLHEQLKFLLRYALLAPSTHNSQPWKFAISDSTITITPESRRLVPIADPDGQLLYITLGCVVENLCLAADYFGFECTITLQFEKKLPRIKVMCNKIASTKFQQKNHLLHAIPKRHTSRGPYQDRTLPVEFLQFSEKFNTPSLQVEIISDRDKKDSLIRILMESREKEMDDHKFRFELAHYKRTNYTRSGLGMPGFVMGFPNALSLIVPMVIRLKNVAKLSHEKDERLLKNATPAFVVISTATHDAPAWLESGRIYQRCALEAVRLGLATNIMAAPVAYEDYYKELQNILGTTLRPQFLFRVGYPTVDAQPSPRLALEKVLGA